MEVTPTEQAVDKIIIELLHLCWVSYQLGAGQKYNTDPTLAQLESHTDALKFHRAHPDATPESNHENWMQYKLSQGWKFGPVKDETKKEHPDLVPFDQLPDVEKRKDIMDLIARQACQRLALMSRNLGYRAGAHAALRALKDTFDEMDDLVPTDDLALMVSEKINAGIEAGYSRP